MFFLLFALAWFISNLDEKCGSWITCGTSKSVLTTLTDQEYKDNMRLRLLINPNFYSSAGPNLNDNIQQLQHYKCILCGKRDFVSNDDGTILLHALEECRNSYSKGLMNKAYDG